MKKKLKRIKNVILISTNIFTQIYCFDYIFYVSKFILVYILVAEVILNCFLGIFFPMGVEFFVLFLLLVTSVLGIDPQWTLVTESELANFASQVLARTFLGAVTQVVLSKTIGAGITTNVSLSHFFPVKAVCNRLLKPGQPLCFPSLKTA